MSDFSPARCEILKAIITPYGRENVVSEDISAIIGAFDIEHGIGKLALTGSITVLDTTGFLERFPLRGEETLDLEIKSYDLQTVRKIKAHIYKITDIEPNSLTKGVTYTLHWISNISWKAAQRKITKAYNDKEVSTIIKEIFNQYFAELKPHTTRKTDGIELPPETTIFNVSGEEQRKFVLQNTSGKTFLTIPRYSPTEAIGFCLKRAFNNTQSKSSSFRFFETWDGFYSVSDEWFFQKAAANGISQSKVLNYSAYVDLDPLNIDEQVKSLESFVNPSRIDSARDLAGGGYKNTFVEIDLLNHTVIRHNYAYLEGNNKFKDVKGKDASWQTDTHTEKFANEVFTNENARQFLVMRDYRDGYDGKAFAGEKHYRELVSQRVMYNAHMSATQVQATTSGRLDLSPGDVIHVNIRELNASTNQIEKNNQLSGRYLITYISNVCNSDILSTQLTLFKYDWSGANIDTRANIQ